MESPNESAPAWPFIVAAGAAALSAMPIALLWQRLPDPIAVHWSAQGVPNGSMSKLGFILFNTALLALFAYAGGRRKPKAGRASALGSLVIAGLIGTLLPSGAMMCALLNLDASNWQHAASLPLSRVWLLLVPSIVTVAVGLAVGALRHGGSSGGGSAGGSQTVPLVPSEEPQSRSGGSQSRREVPADASSQTWSGIPLCFVGPPGVGNRCRSEPSRHPPRRNLCCRARVYEHPDHV